MKKSKILLVAVLAVVLCFVCIFTQTFSWFTLPKNMEGDSLQLNGYDYNASTGSDISVVTYESNDDGETFGDTPVTYLSNSTGIEAGKRKYYRTDIINASDSAQNVSVYLSNLEIPENSNGNFYLGVNSPLKTYKAYGILDSQRVIRQVNKKNVYVGFVSTVKYNIPSDYMIHYWNDSGLTGDEFVTSSKIGTGNYTVSEYSNYTESYNMYPVTIPYDAKKMKLKHKNGYDRYAGDNNDIDSKNTVIWFHYDNNYHAAYMISGVAAGIDSFYSSATVLKDETINIAATGQGTITYSSSNEDIATVSSSGEVKGVNVGSAKITVTSQGAYGDTITSTCTVIVASDDNNHVDVPIVTNLRVGAASDDGATVESVYWYIKNDSETGVLQYTISDLYVTL